MMNGVAMEDLFSRDSKKTKRTRRLIKRMQKSTGIWKAADRKSGKIKSKKSTRFMLKTR
jgi:hypothetical protein